MNRPAPYTFFQRLAAAYFFAFSALLPLKAGSLVIADSVGLWHPNIIGWVVSPWPWAIFYPAAGLALILNALAFPIKLKKAPGVMYLATFALIAFTAVAGFINSPERWTAVVLSVHLWALWGYLWALFLLIWHRREARYAVIGAWSIGIAVAILAGLHQYFWGFEQELKHIADNDMQVSNELIARIKDRRTHAPFDLTNSLAGFLLLAVPIIGYGLWRAGKHVHPQRFSQILFAGVGVCSGTILFLTTRSRAAFLAAIIALAVVAILKINNLKLRIVVGLCLAIALIGGAFFVVNSERGAATMGYRLDYFRVATETTQSHPFAGAGWGGFRYEYMLNKGNNTFEAPQDPHNVILALSSQAGIIPGVLMLLLLAMPVIATLRRRKTSWEEAVLLFALLGFTVHALAEVHLVVPAIMALMLTTGALLLSYDSAGEPARRPLWLGVIIGVAIIAAGVYILRADYYRYQLSELPRNRPHSELVRAHEKAVAAMPWSSSPYLAAAARSTNDNASQKWLERAKEITPQDPFTYLRIMQLQLARNRYQEAQESLNEARKRFPNTWLLEGTPDEVAKRLRER